MEKVYFHKLVLQAWNFSRVKKLPWIFGSVVALSGLVENHFGAGLTNASSLEELFHILGEKSPQELGYGFLILLLLFVLSVLGKSNLIASLSFVVDKATLPNYPSTSSAIGKNFVRAFIIECLALLFLIIIAGILAIPLLIASRINATAISTLTSFAFLTFIPIALTVFLVKQFALFYILLSPLGIRGAIETGGFLFSRSVSLNLFFVFFSFLLTLLFTFCVNLVILGIVALSEKLSLPLGSVEISLVVSFISFTWFAIFEQALWLTFFKSIAGQKKKDRAEKEKAVDSTTIPEIPPAQ